MGGMGLFAAERGGGFAKAPLMKLDKLKGAVLNADGQPIAKFKECFNGPASASVTVAEGVDAVRVLALTSELEANAAWANRPDMIDCGAGSG